MKTYYDKTWYENKAYLYCCSEVVNFNQEYKRLTHIHEDLVEIILVTNGEGNYSIDGKCYLIKKGDLIILNSYVAHEEFLISKTAVETYCCGIKGLEKKHLRKNALIVDNASPVFRLEKYYPYIKHYMTLLYLLLQDQQTKEAQTIFASLLNFLEKNILNNITLYSEFDNDILLYRVKEYIERFYYEELDLQKMAQLVNINHYYLAHQFKKKFNCSPVQYLIKRRIGEAQTLLENTDKKIVDIAYLIGFNNCSHFQTSFKKHAGITPKQYRTKYQKI